MLTIDHICMEFSSKPVLDDITFLINRKERIALVGKNGAGKSTAIRTMLGMIKVTSGEGKVLGFDNPENPTIIEDFIEAIGGEPVIYPYRSECCGGYVSLKEKEMAGKMVDKIRETEEQDKKEKLEKN